VFLIEPDSIIEKKNNKSSIFFRDMLFGSFFDLFTHKTCDEKKGMFF